MLTPLTSEPRAGVHRSHRSHLSTHQTSAAKPQNRSQDATSTTLSVSHPSSFWASTQTSWAITLEPLLSSSSQMSVPMPFLLPSPPSLLHTSLEEHLVYKEGKCGSEHLIYLVRDCARIALAVTDSPVINVHNCWVPDHCFHTIFPYNPALSRKLLCIYIPITSPAC